MMMLRVIVLASALALGKAAPSTSRNLAGRELGNRENCDGTPGNEKGCYKGTKANPGILALDKDEKGSICTRQESWANRNTCHGCLECTDPNEVCEPRANEETEEHPFFRTFSSMTTSPYYDMNKNNQGGDGPCCAWCDSEKHAETAWKLKDATKGATDARCEWNRYCSGCTECD